MVAIVLGMPEQEGFARLQGIVGVEKVTYSLRSNTDQKVVEDLDLLELGQ
jgi:hypothetical protein